MSPGTRYTSIGGQAVIEGVMMRSPHFVAIAVRKANGRIALRFSSYRSISERVRFLKKPVFRGVVTLIESMVQGISALSYSANVAAEGEESGEELSSWAIAGSITMALALGMGLFVALPHFLTVLFASNSVFQISVSSPIFHLVDGILKMAILLIYVYAIALMKDIHRVFQYHGAEHKSIYAFEAGEDLTVENARKHTALHPRCGTSFLLFLVLISIGVFSIVFPLFHLTEFSENKLLNHTLMVLVKIVLMLPVAGLSYEFIKVSAGKLDNPIFRGLIWPGLALQRLTTREPTDDQLEVALASLRQALRLEKGIERVQGAKKDGAVVYDEIEVGGLMELGHIAASVAEFPEA